MQARHMKILIISKSFPSSQFPSSGIFVKDFADTISLSNRIEILSPKPYTNKLLASFSPKWRDIGAIEPRTVAEKYSIRRPIYISLPRKILYKYAGYLYWIGIRRSFQPTEYDLIHVNWLYPDGYIVPILKVKYPKIPIVITIHGSDWYADNDNEKVNSLKGRSLFAADLVLTVGDKLRTDILKVYPDLTHNVVSVPNGIRVDSLDPKSEMETVHFKKGIQKKLLMVGNYVKLKGHIFLFTALKNLRKNGYDFDLILVGNNLEPEYLKYLAAQIKFMGLADKVQFHVSLPRESLVHLYKNCDVFILPSLREGFGLSLIEALAFGKPVISTRSGGPEQIVNTINGLLVPPADSESLFEALKAIMEDQVKFDARKIKAEALGKYSYSNIVAEIEKLYNQIIESS